MVASSRICLGGRGGRNVCSLRCDRRAVLIARSPDIVPFSGRWSCRLSEIHKVSMSMPNAAVKLEGRKMGDGRYGGAVVTREKLDEWMRTSVVDIVKNLRETPLLLHVYAGANGALSSLKTATTMVKAEDWPAVKGRWDRGEEQTPEGVIIVEKLRDDEVLEENDQRDDAGDASWGIVAQGRGMECGPVCYLLKTTRVGSGNGPVCTHFCLVKVKSFRETAMSQLRNCWLVEAGQ